MQPFIIVEGSSLTEVNKSYIIVDQIRYEFENVKQAFDVLFKIYHVMNAKYPPQAEHIWYIIQKCFYEISTKFDKTIPYIVEYFDVI